MHSRRTVLMLALCQALAMTGGSIVATTASIVGSMLAPDRALSTLPIAVQMTGMMTATIPAALLMARIGRRRRLGRIRAGNREMVERAVRPRAVCRLLCGDRLSVRGCGDPLVLYRSA